MNGLYDLGRVVLIACLLASAPTTVAGSDHLPSVVVTTEVLGSVVREVVGDRAEVTTLMPAGADPHTWQPSARDSEALFAADLVIANGSGLEEGLVDLLAQAESGGVAVFRATDHLGAEVAAHDGEAEEDHVPAPGLDPHFWLDPLAMRGVVLALEPVLGTAGVAAGDGAARVTAELEALDGELAKILAAVPSERRRLVTGHGALGPFADRYGLEIVGTVIPGLSSSDEPSARDIAELIEVIRQGGATAILVDPTTPLSIADAVAAETGVPIVEIGIEQLPPSGEYADLLRGLAATVAATLAATLAS